MGRCLINIAVDKIVALSGVITLANINVRVVSYLTTEKPLTVIDRIQVDRNKKYGLPNTVHGVTSNTGKIGHWLRHYFIDPLFIYKANSLVVINRNYEATYTIQDLEPMTRLLRTYALQEYFVPLANLKSFAFEMLRIFKNYKVNVINISIRHALQDDPRLLLSWAPNSEVFAFVIYHSQLTTTGARTEVGEWTPELIDLAVTKNGGTYYLPYQLHATREQIYKAYPR
ncbi:unnamed protein product, partial [Rotaria magnacalcarata]